MRISIVLLGLFFFVGCSNVEKSIELTRQAKNIFLFESLESQVKIDSSLQLLDQAIKLDDKNLAALEMKITVLTEKRDVNEILNTNSKIIKIRPGYPYWKIQRSIFLNIKGETNKANQVLEEALNDYEILLNGKLDDFDLNIEYLTALNLDDQLDKANFHLELMRNYEYEGFQNQMLKHYTMEPREAFMNFWFKKENEPLQKDKSIPLLEFTPLKIRDSK